MFMQTKRHFNAFISEINEFRRKTMNVIARSKLNRMKLNWNSITNYTSTQSFNTHYTYGYKDRDREPRHSAGKKRRRREKQITIEHIFNLFYHLEHGLPLHRIESKYKHSKTRVVSIRWNQTVYRLHKIEKLFTY